MKISLQTTVKVKLTEKALDILREKADGVFVIPPTDRDGYSTWSLYTVMNKLGVEIDIEKPTELIDDEIIILE